MEGGRRCCHQAASPIKLEPKKRVEDVKRYTLVGRLMKGRSGRSLCTDFAPGFLLILPCSYATSSSYTLEYRRAYMCTTCLCPQCEVGCLDDESVGNGRNQMKHPPPPNRR